MGAKGGGGDGWEGRVVMAGKGGGGDGWEWKGGDSQSG